MLSPNSLPIYAQLRATITGAEAQGLNERELAEILVPMLQPDDREVDTHEAARFLGKSPITLEQYRWKKIGPRYRKTPSGLVRYKISWLKKYQESGTEYGDQI